MSQTSPLEGFGGKRQRDQDHFLQLGATGLASMLRDQNCWAFDYSSDNNSIQRRKSRFFFFFFLNSLLTTPRTVCNRYAQIGRAQLCANHVQYIERISRATCHVTFHVVRRDSSAIKFDRVEIAFILALFYWLKPINRGIIHRSTVICRPRSKSSRRNTDPSSRE